MRPRVHRKLTLEELEPRIAPGVAVAYVDDDFNSGTPGWGVDHFALIQDGVAAVDAGGAVDVAGGVYNETVTLDRNATVNLQGAETLGGVTMSTGTIVCAGSNLTIISDYSQSGGAFVSAPTQGSFSVGGNFSLSGGTFNRFTGSGGAGDPYLIHDVYGLQAMKFGLGASYQLADDVDAAATSAWNGGLGFDPVGDLDHRFTGSLHGDGRTIAGLHIVRPSENFVGLIGFATDGSSVTNVGLVGGTVQGYAGVGGLVGWNSGDISHCYTTMDVSGNWIVGGLVGDHCYGDISDSYATGSVGAVTNGGGLAGFNYFGTISGSYATGAVGGEISIGGLVGVNEGAISHSFATGSVSGVDGVGGLAGLNSEGTVSDSYATGSVEGGEDVGGLVGTSQRGNVFASYATGGVSATGTDIGGLVGRNTGSTVSASYAAGRVSGGSWVGGLVGNNDEGAISDSYAVGSVSGDSLVGGLVGRGCNASVTRSYAAGSVSGGSYVGGFEGYDHAGNITDSHWDVETSGQTLGVGYEGSAGATGETTAEMKQQATFSGWDTASTWAIVEGLRYPLLRWQTLSLSDGASHVFQDGDGSTVQVSYNGPGSGFLALVNGQTTGAAMDAIVLDGSTTSSSLSMSSTGGTALGASVFVLVLDPDSSGDSFGNISGTNVSMAAGGGITAGGAVTGVSMAEFGDGVTISISGDMEGFTAGNVGDDFTMSVTGGMETLTANAIGDGAGVTAGGSVGSIQVATRTGAYGNFWVYGSLGTFQASTLGDANIVAAAIDGGTFGAFQADVVKSGSAVGSVHGLGTFGAAEVGDGVLVCAGSLDVFNVPIVGNDFVLWYTENGTLGDFQASTIGNDMLIIWGRDIENISVEGNVGTGGHVLIYEGGLRNFSAGDIGDGFSLDVRGADGTGAFSADSVGSHSNLYWGHGLSSLTVAGDIRDEVSLDVRGSLGAFAAGNIGDDFTINVAEEMGTFTADAVGDRAMLNCDGGAGTVHVSNAIGRDGFFWICGPLDSFHASTVGDGTMVVGAIVGDDTFGSFTADLVGAGSTVATGGALGTFQATEVRDGVRVIAGVLDDFQAGTIGDGFVLTDEGWGWGPVTSFSAGSVGNDLRIEWTSDLGDVSVVGDVGTGGQIIVGGSLGALSAGNIGRDFTLNVTGAMGTLTANAIGDRALLTAGGSVGSIWVETSTGADGAFWVCGSLGSFHASTLGDGSYVVGAVTSGSFGSFTAGLVGADSAVESGGDFGTLSATEFQDNGVVITGSLDELCVPTIGNNFLVESYLGGTLKSFLSSNIGDGLNIHWAGDIESMSVTGAIGTGAAICVGGSLGTVGVGSGSWADATITAGEGIGAVILTNGGIQGVIVANGTAGIGSISVTGGSADVDITTPNGKVGSLTVAGASSSGQYLSGSLNVLGIDTLVTTWAGLQDLLLTAGAVGSMEVDGSVTGNSSIRVTATTGVSLGAILIKGDLASTADYAIEVMGTLDAASRIEITGTAATGGFGLGRNRIKIGELDGELLAGTNTTVGVGVFGDVVVLDSLHSTGRLTAAALNELAVLYSGILDPDTVTHQIIGSNSGYDWEILFGSNQSWS